MNCISQFVKQSPLEKIITFSKILIIFFVAFYLLTNFNPYYEGNDAYSYAITAKLLADGSLFYSNSLSETTGQIEFIPQDHYFINELNSF